MSIVMPVTVVLETSAILWLLTVLARRQRAATSIGSRHSPRLSARYAARVMLGLRVVRARLFRMTRSASSFDSLAKAGSSEETCEPRTGNLRVPGAGQRGARAGHPFAERLSTMASARVVHREPFERGGQPVRLVGSHAGGAVERESGERYFRKALALLPFAVLVLDAHGLIVMVSPQTAKLSGYECDEIIGKSVELLVRDLHFDSDARFWVDPSAVRQSRGMAPSHELSARRKDGTEFPVEIGFSAFRFDGHNVTLAFIVDQSDRYELHRNRQELAHLTRVSTMGQLASSLAHELNQPLTAILSNVQAAQRFMAADPIDLDEVREILNDIVQDDYRASEVIRRIRAVVRKGDLEVAPLHLACEIRDVVVLMRSDAIVRGMRVVLDIDGDLPPVRGDKVQLQQVILNLLLNAFDAMNNVPPLDRVVSVTLRPGNNGMVCIAVRDRGHGLTSDKLDKIFTPFFTSKPQGLGLGLSISRSIIDMHRGRLWAENNIDRGATFYVTLPAEDMTATGQDESRTGHDGF
ncbi:sensor histidine kinase [Paraburkholderia sartisoli]|uniref:histidine kinase n=1 Tax=Paraburkholderia sartisoli TaxID=83784 RepID=A0A1H4H212_9BURK|nr:ATP-binding protein [Paraburkholderia sartisoli]SEB15786.1 two-component system, LuxR family, sensor kinase FixL [Paraburkholderia sartisoli]